MFFQIIHVFPALTNNSQFPWQHPHASVRVTFCLCRALFPQSRRAEVPKQPAERPLHKPYTHPHPAAPAAHPHLLPGAAQGQALLSVPQPRARFKLGCGFYFNPPPPHIFGNTKPLTHLYERWRLAFPHTHTIISFCVDFLARAVWQNVAAALHAALAGANSFTASTSSTSASLCCSSISLHTVSPPLLCLYKDEHHELYPKAC